MTARRPDGRRLVALAVAGYLAAWAASAWRRTSPTPGWRRWCGGPVWLTFNGWALAAAVLAGAGLFQFSGLKYRCLDRCRSPVGLVLEHWRGRRPRREAWAWGWAHGVFCVGCCWALML